MKFLNFLLIGIMAAVMTSCKDAGTHPVPQAPLEECVYSGDKTVFSVWAPDAEAAQLKLYISADAEDASKIVDMKKAKDGLWKAVVKGDELPAGQICQHIITILLQCHKIFLKVSQVFGENYRMVRVQFRQSGADIVCHDRGVGRGKPDVGIFLMNMAVIIVAVVMVVMMVVMAMMLAVMLYMTMLVVAMFTHAFQLKCRMGNTVLVQFFTH